MIAQNNSILLLYEHKRTIILGILEEYVELALKGKVAVVTGGARGIGAAISSGLARSGVAVVVNFLPMERDVKGFEIVRDEIEGFGGRCTPCAGDITDTGFCSELCKTAVDTYGRLDIIVNSAGFAAPIGCEATTDEQWKLGIEVNLSAAFYVTRASLEYMENTKSGRIIFVGSAGSITGGGGSAFYSAAKAGHQRTGPKPVQGIGATGHHRKCSIAGSD
jgi:3-oxoacyl-[acyl-carrier protein] reductase